MSLPAFRHAFALLAPPGIVRAVSSNDVGLRIGESVQQALGIAWAELLGIARESGRQADTPLIVTPRGRFRLASLTGAEDEISGVLLVLEQATAVSTTSSAPPSSAPRFVADLSAIAGKDPAARAAVDLALRFARTKLPIYIAAEEGAGADALATALVRASDRAGGALLRLSVRDTAALAQLLPTQERPFGNGTLVIEDAHEFDAETGARLWRTLDRGIYSEARLIATGAGDLRERVQKGIFAHELYTLVRSSTVTLPALRDRDDFGHVVQLMLSAVNRTLLEDEPNSTGKVELGSDVARRLREHSWPGNLRELRAWLERAVAAALPGKVLEVAHFPFDIAEAGSEPPDKARTGLRRSAEKAALEEALRAAAGNVSIASKRLGVARSTLYRLMLRHGIVR